MQALSSETVKSLSAVLVSARYKIFVAVRPIGPAREAFDLIVSEFTQALRKEYGDFVADEFRKGFTSTRENS